MLKYRNGKDPFDEIADFVILHEGFEENKSGKDLVTGARWIGSGIEVPKYLELFDKTGKWTAADNRKAVKEILSGYTPQLKKTFGPVWDKLSSNQKLVLYDVAYNIGVGNLTEKSPKFVKAVLSGDNETAMREMNWGNYQTRGLRNRNANRRTRWGGVPFKLDPIKFTKTGDGNKVITIDPEYWEQLGMLQPVQKEQPVLQSALTGPIKTISPRIEDVATAPWNLNQQSLNQGIEVKPYKSPFSLNLSLPSLDSLLLINSPLRLMELYFADALGISDMLPLTPSLFPKLKNGKLPRYADGDTPDGYPLNIPDIVVSGKNKSGYTLNDKFNAAKEWLTGTWLPGRKQYLLDRVNELVTEYLQNLNYDPYNIDYGDILKYVTGGLRMKTPDLAKDYERNKAGLFANMDTFKLYLRNYIGWNIDAGINAINNAKLINYATALESDYPKEHPKWIVDRRFENPDLGAFVYGGDDRYVYGRGNNSISELIHELNHIGLRYYTGYDSSRNSLDLYYDRPTERHSRQMQYRYENSESPMEFIYPDKEDLQDYHLDNNDDFNYVAMYKNGKSSKKILPRLADGRKPVLYTSKDGTMYNIDPNVVGSKLIEVTSPDVVVTGRDLSKPYRSTYAFNPTNVETAIQDAIKQRAYKSITPIGYNLPKVTREFINGERDDNYHAYAPMREALWAHYLGLPLFEYQGGTGNTADWIVESPYQPTKGVATYGKTYRFNPEKFSYYPKEGFWESYLSDSKISKYFRERARQGKDNVQFTDGNSDLGPYTMGSGRDENGPYVSYYDDWDINIGEGDSAPEWAKKLRAMFPKGDMLEEHLKTHPISMYDRRYLTEDEWRRLGGYKDGKSPIHIKPANRGKFTRLKKRTGKSASWFKAHGTPAQKKMATFALNARKWKH